VYRPSGRRAAGPQWRSHKADRRTAGTWPARAMITFGGGGRPGQDDVQRTTMYEYEAIITIQSRAGKYLVPWNNRTYRVKNKLVNCLNSL
jgi:hypothetical protein